MPLGTQHAGQAKPSGESLSAFLFTTTSFVTGVSARARLPRAIGRERHDCVAAMGTHVAVEAGIVWGAKFAPVSESCVEVTRPIRLARLAGPERCNVRHWCSIGRRYSLARGLLGEIVTVFMRALTMVMLDKEEW